MKKSFRTGFSFGLTSGIITTLGLIVGLYNGTGSKVAVIGGILTIAIADSFSDAMGIHVSEEEKGSLSNKGIWESTISTFLTKFIFASTFVIPVLLLSLGQAIVACIIWGLLLLGVFSYYIGKKQKGNPWHVVGEHLFIALLVIVLTNLAGNFIASEFK